MYNSGTLKKSINRLHVDFEAFFSKLCWSDFLLSGFMCVNNLNILKTAIMSPLNLCEREKVRFLV